MSKEQLIETIRHHNPTAAREFLESFNAQALDRYLRRLRCVGRPRDAVTMWMRGGEVAAPSTIR